MNIIDIKPQMRVAYVPGHAHGDEKHPDVEHGTVSSTNSKYVFVKFDKQLKKFGWDGTTSQSCDPGDLLELADKYGNTEDNFQNCCFPDCGCDGARLCDAPSGPSDAAMFINIEKRSGKKLAVP